MSPLTIMTIIDREHLYSLLNHKVLVVTSHLDQQEAYLVCVDPVTLTIVLYDLIHQSLSMVLHHAIKSIEVKQDQENDLDNIDFKQICANFFGISPVATSNAYSQAELQERRERALKLLKANNVPVEENDNLLIAAYSVCINAPYPESDCQSTNALILSRIQNILKEESK